MKVIKPIRYISPKMLYKRDKEENNWKEEYEVRYALDKERKEDKEVDGEELR